MNAERGQRTVTVQVCGRRETLAVAGVDAQSIALAVEKRFEVKPPYLFADQQGRFLSNDNAIADYAEGGDPLVVRLAEGVLHDFGRRVDQIRHLQWGFLADQLAASKQELGHQGDLLKKSNLALGEEQAARQVADAELQRGLDGLRELFAREQEARDAAQKEADARHLESQTKLRQAVEGINSAMRKEREDLQALIVAEATAREDSVLRLRRDVSELKEALALEESIRKDADDALLGTFQQAKNFAVRDAEGRLVEMQGLANTVRDLQNALVELKAELSRTHGGMDERHHEEKAVRKQAHESAERQMAELRHMLAVEAHERNMALESMDKLSQDVVKRSADEAQARKIECEHLFRLITEESSKRQENTKKISEMIGAVEQGSGHHIELRAREIRDLEQSIQECKEQLKIERTERVVKQTDMERRSETSQNLLSKLREDCKEAMSREVRSRVDREQALREDLEQRLGMVREELEKLFNGWYDEPDSNANDLSGLSSGTPRGAKSRRVPAYQDALGMDEPLTPSERGFGGFRY